MSGKARASSSRSSRKRVVDDDDAEPVPVPNAAASKARQGGKSAQAAAAKPAKKKKTTKLNDIAGFDDLPSGGNDNGASTGAAATKKREKIVEAIIMLAQHQQGPKKGQLSGRAFYAISSLFEDNKELQAIVLRIMKQKPKWFSDWSKWAVRCPTAELALKLHASILAEPKLRATAAKLKSSLDVSAYSNPAVTKYNYTLVESETQFETRADGLLPRSIMVVGPTFDFKEFFKEKFEAIRYLDLVFDGGNNIKSAWVLPVAAQTAATGTLADYLRSLGVTVTEVDLDEGEDSDEEEDERDDDALIDDEAEEDEELE